MRTLFLLSCMTLHILCTHMLRGVRNRGVHNVHCPRKWLHICECYKMYRVRVIVLTLLPAWSKWLQACFSSVRYISTISQLTRMHHNYPSSVHFAVHVHAVPSIISWGMSALILFDVGMLVVQVLWCSCKPHPLNTLVNTAMAVLLW